MRVHVTVAVLLTASLSLASAACMRSYLNASKQAEARNCLGMIAKDAAASYERERVSGVVGPAGTPPPLHTLCDSASKPVPASPADIRGKKYMSSPSEWTVDGPDKGFACLKFSMDAPQYYMYSYTRSGSGSSVGDGFTAKANGDLNGDGTLSTFQIAGRVGASSDVEIAPSLTEINPAE